MGGSISGGDILFRILGDNSGLNQALDDAGVSIKGASQAMLGLGAAITGALAGTVWAWAEAGGAIKDFSDRTGIGAEATSELKFALEQSGASLGTMETALMRVNKGMDEARLGGTGYADTLARIGLSVTDLAGLSPDEQFIKIGVATAQLSDASERSAVGMELLGKQFGSLLPTFLEGEAGIASLRARAEELGITFTDETAGRAEALGDTMAELKASLLGVAYEIAPLVATLVEEFVPVVIDTIRSIREWMAAHPELTSNLITAAGVVGSLSLALGTLGLALGPIISTVTGAIGIFGALSGAVGGLGAVAGGAGVIGVSGLAVALAGPVGLAAAVGVAGFAIYGLIDAHISLKQAQDEHKAGTAEVNKEVLKYAESLKGTWKEMDTSTLKGLGYDEAMAKINEHVNAARIEGGHYGDSVRETGDAWTGAAQPMDSAASILQALANNSAEGQAAMQAQTAQTWAFVDAIIAMNNAISSSPPMPSGNAMPGPMFPGFDTGIPLGMASGLGRGASGAGENTAPGGNSVTINITVSGGMAAGEDANALSNKLGNEIVSRLRAVGVA